MATQLTVKDNSGAVKTLTLGLVPEGAATETTLQSILDVTQAGAGLIKNVPAGKAQGTILTGVTETSVGIEFQLDPGESVTYTLVPFGADAPTSAPVVRAAKAMNPADPDESSYQMPWAVNIKGLDVYVIQVVGNPTYRVM